MRSLHCRCVLDGGAFSISNGPSENAYRDLSDTTAWVQALSNNVVTDPEGNPEGTHRYWVV